MSISLEYIKILCAKRETKTVEFKTSTALLRAAFETICAFLNGKGGIVLIGIRDDGKIVGQEISDNTRRDIAREIKRIEPTANIEVDYVEIEENKFVIAIQVKAGSHTPYAYDSRPFQRDESETNRMSQHRYEQLIVERGQLNHSWEEIITSEYTIDDLDHEEIYKTVAEGIHEGRIPARAKGENIRDILNRLNLMVDDNLKRAAVVLYAKQESMKFVQCMIKMARFKGLDKLGNFIDNQQFYGNAFKILSEVDSFLRRHLPIASFFKSDQFQRIDIPQLPVLAVREAVVNAICHRDYSDYYTDISLAIFDDRLEIWNSGLLLNKLTPAALRQVHESVLRNKLIANTFYVRGFIEKWGSGTNKMIELCKKEHIPEPEFVERTGGLTVVFKFKESIKQIDFSKNESEGKLNKRQQAILLLIKKFKALNINKIINELENSPSQRMVRKDLNHLRKANLIKLEGYGKNALWVLKDKDKEQEEPRGTKRNQEEPRGTKRNL